jgi:hypothetical protein
MTNYQLPTTNYQPPPSLLPLLYAMSLAARGLARMALTMKLNVALTRSLLMAASIGMVIPVIAQTPPKAAPNKATPPVKGPAKPARPPEVDAPPEATIAGLAIPREQGGYLGLAIEDSKLQLRFYDSKKKLLAPDVPRAALKWTSTKRKGDEYVVLTPSSDGKSLTNERVIPPPYNFRVLLRLLQADESANVEAYTVQLTQ